MTVLCLALLLMAGLPEDPFTAKREAMVNVQICRRGITDKAVISAMHSVKRHLFVSEQLQDLAYDDRPLPIGHGQTISQPYIVAYMTSVLKLKPGARVLEIGTGSGYQAAILASMSTDVYTVEIIPELGRQAGDRFRKLGYKNISSRIADGYDGWEEHAPYDAIIVTAAADYIPPPLIRQLKDGGCMVIPVGSPFIVQTLMLVEKKTGAVRTSSLLPVRFVPLQRSR